MGEEILTPPYSAIVQNSPIGYCLITKELELTYINDKLLGYTGLNIDQVMGRNWINTIIEKNFLKPKNKVIHRWLRIRLNSKTLENKFVMKILDDLGTEFYIQIDHVIENDSDALNKNEIPQKDSGKRLVTIYPVSGTILLHQSRLTRTLDAEYIIAGKIQRNINNYIMDSIEGRYFKYHFKRLFLPSGILSGDIVNIKPVSRRYSSVFLGDGRGHGLPAALYSALIHSYLNIMASEVNHGLSSTGKLLQQINKNAYRDFVDTGEYYFFSGVYGLIDGNSRDFFVTNAGHPYPVFIRDGEVSTLISNGPLVGIDKDSIYTENKIELKDNDKIIFFTDGLYEVITGEPDPEPIASLVKKYILNNNNNSSGVFQFLVSMIESFKSRREIEDDITLLEMSVEEKKQ